LVDFIGAGKISERRWVREEMVSKLLPNVLQAKQAGIRTMLDCMPAFFARDVRLLQMILQQSGMQIDTSTRYYGAVNNKYLPFWAFT